MNHDQTQRDIARLIKRIEATAGRRIARRNARNALKKYLSDLWKRSTQ